MKKMSLLEYAELNGQEKAALAIGVTQGAISRALKAGRNIFVTENNGKIKAEEIRPFPAKDSNNKAQPPSGGCELKLICLVVQPLR